MAKRPTAHYVDNKRFLQAMKDWKEQCEESLQTGDEPPRVTNYIGECFLKIANGLSHKPNFMNYTFREDMVSDGIENCLQYIHNFNPSKSNNPFAYFTQIIYYAFIRRIQREKKQTHVKNKLIEKQDYRAFVTMHGDETSYNVSGFDPTIMLPDEDVYKPKKKKPIERKEGLENFMDKENEDSNNN